MVKIAVQLGLLSFATIFLAACSGSSGPTERQHPDDWRAEFSRLEMGTTASEDEPISLLRVQARQDFLVDTLGIPVKIYQSSDYNGVIQALSSGQIQIATMGGGSYANVHSQIGELAEPILVRRDTMGISGYYSSIVVRSESPYYKIEDLEGKSLAYVDFNSTSGYIYPRWAMRRQGIEPDEFFSEAAMAGGHLQSVMALANGQFDGTVVSASGGNPEVGFATGTLARVIRRGIVNAEDYRTIWYAGPLPNSPYVIRTDVPPELRDFVRGAIAAMPYESPETFLDMARLPGTAYKAVDRSFYTDLFEMRTEEIASHRKRAIGGGK